LRESFSGEAGERFTLTKKHSRKKSSGYFPQNPSCIIYQIPWTLEVNIGSGINVRIF